MVYVVNDWKPGDGEQTVEVFACSDRAFDYAIRAISGGYTVSSHKLTDTPESVFVVIPDTLEGRIRVFPKDTNQNWKSMEVIKDSTEKIYERKVL